MPSAPPRSPGSCSPTACPSPPTSGAAGTAALVAAGVGLVTRRDQEGHDAGTALVLVAALAAGVILASDVFHSGANVETLLFGSLLLIDGADLAWAAAATSAVLLATARARARVARDGLRPGDGPRPRRAPRRPRRGAAGPRRLRRRGGALGHRRAARHGDARRPGRDHAAVLRPDRDLAARDRRAGRGRGRRRAVAGGRAQRAVRRRDRRAHRRRLRRWSRRSGRCGRRDDTPAHRHRPRRRLRRAARAGRASPSPSSPASAWPCSGPTAAARRRSSASCSASSRRAPGRWSAPSAPRSCPRPSARASTSRSRRSTSR